MREFPDEWIPESGKLSWADYRAMAEWHWLHNTAEHGRDGLRERAERRRAELLEAQVDVSDMDIIDALWAGWQLSWHEALNYGVSSFGDEILPYLVHVMQYTSIMLLLATEPETPAP